MNSLTRLPSPNASPFLFADGSVRQIDSYTRSGILRRWAEGAAYAFNRKSFLNDGATFWGYNDRTPIPYKYYPQ